MTAYHMCAYLYLTPETHAGTQHTSPRPFSPPHSFLTLRRHKAGQGHLKVHRMQHDRTSPTYAFMTVKQIDDWWQASVSSGDEITHRLNVWLNFAFSFLSDATYKAWQNSEEFTTAFMRLSLSLEHQQTKHQLTCKLSVSDAECLWDGNAKDLWTC